MIFNQIKRLPSHVHRITTEVIKTATSKELLKKHLKIPLYQNSYNLMAGAAITSALGFIFWILVARLYSAEAVGLASAILSSLGLIALFSELGLGIGLIRFLPSSGKMGNDMLNTCLTLSGSASITVALIFLAGLGFWSPALLPMRQNPVFLTSFIIFAFLLSISPLVANTFLARRNTKYTVFMRLINHLASIVFLVIIAFFLSTAYGIFSSYLLATTMALTIAIVWFLPNVQADYRPFPRIRKWVISELGFYSIGNYIGRLLLQVTNLVLPLMVINTLGAEQNAYFYIAWAIAIAIEVIPSSIFNSLFAEVSNVELSLRANTIKSLRLMLLLVIPAVLLILIIAPILLLLFGKAYSDSGTLLFRLVALSVIPWGINYLYVSIARVHKGVKGMISVAGTSATLSLGLSYFLMLNMGLVGVGIGYLAGQSIVAIVVAIYLWRSYHSHSGLLGRSEKVDGS